MNNIIADSTNEMYRWFDILNEKYFNNSLSRDSKDKKEQSWSFYTR